MKKELETKLLLELYPVFAGLLMAGHLAGHCKDVVPLATIDTANKIFIKRIKKYLK